MTKAKEKTVARAPTAAATATAPKYMGAEGQRVSRAAAGPDAMAANDRRVMRQVGANPTAAGAMMAGGGGGTTGRARTMNTLQRAIGNARIGRLLDTPEKEPSAEAAPAKKPARVLPFVQRKCNGACECSECKARRAIQRKANVNDDITSSIPDNVTEVISSDRGEPLRDDTRRTMEPALNADLSGVRVHASPQAARAARDINAQAFTYGQDVYFGAGRYDPGSHSGQRLIAHELTHTIQQANGALKSEGGVSQPNDPLEREADAVAARVVPGGSAAGAISSGDSSIQRSVIGDLAEGALDVAGDVGSAIGDVASGAADIASDVASGVSDIAARVWDEATDFASAVGGVVSSLANGGIVIDVPAMQVCPIMALQFRLPEISKDLPFIEGILPITPVVSVYGSIGLHAGLTPEIGGQIGPCYLHDTRIVIDPLAMSYSARGGLTITTALSLGAELRAGLKGEVGVIVIWPDPPIPIQIPVASIEAGLTGFARGIAASTLSIDGSLSYSPPGDLSLSVTRDEDLGLALDLGLAGYGALSLLGFNLCTLYWPLWEWHGQRALNTSIGIDLNVDTSGPSVDLDVDDPTLEEIPFGEIPVALKRDMFTDDCPICDALYAAGVMPSQTGVTTPFNPAPLPGPLPDVYPNDPGYSWGSLCRGACGPDCDTCEPPRSHWFCEDMGNGRHRIWHYPNYHGGPTHQGCREHDACYDWCASGGETSILGPCHRVCDLDCVCRSGVGNCVGWIFGKGGDATRLFSDPPYVSGECDGPCPTEPQGDGGLRICLPVIELFKKQNVLAKALHEETKQYTIWRDDIWVPYVGLVTLEIYGSGSLDAKADANVGPGTIENICFDVDPATGRYRAEARLKAPADFTGSITVAAKLGADARWFLIVKVASAEGLLEAMGKITAKAAIILDGLAEVSCAGGKPTLEANLSLPGAVEVLFELNAGFTIKALTFEVFSKKWNLARATWNKKWGQDVLAKPTGREPDLDLSGHTISLTDILEWLMSDEAEQGEPGHRDANVRENPMTADTAKTIPALVPDLNRTSFGTGTVTLLGGSSATVGTDMMTRYLTYDNAGNGSDNTGPAQTAIYGFRKLPQNGAFGGSGFKKEQVFIKGHLLNHKVGGPAEDRNLYPITGKANGDHERRVESNVKRMVNTQKLVVMYGVRRTGENGPHPVDVFGDGTCTYEYIDANFDCTYATYTLYDDNTVEMNSPVNDSIPSQFDAPGFISGVAGKGCPQRP